MFMQTQDITIGLEMQPKTFLSSIYRNLFDMLAVHTVTRLAEVLYDEESGEITYFKMFSKNRFEFFNILCDPKTYICA